VGNSDGFLQLERQCLDFSISHGHFSFSLYSGTPIALKQPYLNFIVCIMYFGADL